MSVDYKIEMPDNCSATLWKLIMDNFNVVVNRVQHSLDGEDLHIELKIVDNKMSDDKK